MPAGVDDYEYVRDSGFLKLLKTEGLVVSGEEVDFSLVGPVADDAVYVVEHPLLPIISYPYEWSFLALKEAALLHLNIQIRALKAGISLSDASAYNIQFLGPKPIFIDYLSFRKYQDGEFWIAHRQFCEQFLNPLLLRSILGVAHNAWYRGNQEGIGTTDLARLLPVHKKLSWNVLTQVVLQARFQNSAVSSKVTKVAEAANTRKLPKSSYLAMLRNLHKWIARLEPPDTGATVWGAYADSNSYGNAEAKAKSAFIAKFASAVKPRQLWDIGCNTGEYTKVALFSGAASAVGFDFDQGALEQAFARASAEKLNFLPLFLDAANESPSQGWAGYERMGLAKRKSADALISLAFVHHMAITRNIPLNQLVDWLIGFAPDGVIEFVPKTDPMVQDILRLRDDVFQDYTPENFLACVSSQAEIVDRATVTESGRLLVRYQRR